MIELLTRGLPAIDEGLFRYFELNSAFDVTVCEFRPQTEIPSHAHANDVVNIVLDGDVRFVLPESERTLRKGDSIAIPGGVDHAVESKGGATLLELWRK